MIYEVHVLEKGQDPKVEKNDRYVSAYEGICGDAWVLSVDRQTHKGTLSSDDVDGSVNINTMAPFGNIVLDPGEEMWLKACWMNILKKDLASIQKMFNEAAMRNIVKSRLSSENR